MKEIHTEIGSQPDSIKKRYQGNLGNQDTEILELETPDPQHIKNALAPPPVDPETIGPL